MYPETALALRRAESMPFAVEEGKERGKPILFPLDFRVRRNLSSLGKSWLPPTHIKKKNCAFVCVYYHCNQFKCTAQWH